MGFTKHTQVKAGSRASYTKSIVDQLQEADGDIVLWQQELCEQAGIPVPGVYAPVMTALEYLGLVDRYTGDEDEGLGKANTGYAWVSDTVEVKEISSKRERRPGQTKEEFEDGDEESLRKSRRTKATGKVSAKRSRQEEPEDEEEDEPEEEEAPRRGRRASSTSSRRSRRSEPEPEDEEEEDDPEEEEEEAPRSRRSSKRSSSGTRSARGHRSSKSQSDEEEEDEPEEEAPKSRRRPSRAKAVVEEEPEEDDEPKPRRRPRRRAAA